MATAEAAAEAIKQLNGKDVDGRTLKVELANSDGRGRRPERRGGYRARWRQRRRRSLVRHLSASASAGVS